MDDAAEFLKAHGIVSVLDLPPDHPARIDFEQAAAEAAKAMAEAIEERVFHDVFRRL